MAAGQPVAMSRWPPAVWLLILCGSPLMLVGVGGDWNPEAFFPGLLLVLMGCGLALYLAYGRRRGKPVPRGVAWLVPATAMFYVVVAAAAALAGGEYVIAALAAALIPLTAAALLVAIVRTKTAGAGGAHRDPTADADDDPFPGIGIDDATALGDTSEHSDAERTGEPHRRPWINPGQGRPSR